MKIACLQFNPIQENTYVVWDDTKARTPRWTTSSPSTG